MENALTDSSSIRIRVIKNLGSKLPGLSLLYVAVLSVNRTIYSFYLCQLGTNKTTYKHFETKKQTNQNKNQKQKQTNKQTRKIQTKKKKIITDNFQKDRKTSFRASPPSNTRIIIHIEMMS